MNVFALSKSKKRAKILSMGVSKTSDPINIKVKMTNPNQEPPAFSKATNQYLTDVDVLCTLKTKIESQNLETCEPKTSDHIQINICIQNPNEYVKEIDFLCTFEIKKD